MKLALGNRDRPAVADVVTVAVVDTVAAGKVASEGAIKVRTSSQLVS
jgi:hypothetical protein